MIAQGAAIARDTTTVEKYIREESTSTDDTTWTAKYDVTSTRTHRRRPAG